IGVGAAALGAIEHNRRAVGQGGVGQPFQRHVESAGNAQPRMRGGVTDIDKNGAPAQEAVNFNSVEASERHATASSCGAQGVLKACSARHASRPVYAFVSEMSRLKSAAPGMGACGLRFRLKSGLF